MGAHAVDDMSDIQYIPDLTEKSANITKLDDLAAASFEHPEIHGRVFWGCFLTGVIGLAILGYIALSSAV